MNPMSICAFILVSVALMGCTSESTNDPSLLLHYSFEGIMESVVPDMSGNGHDGTLLGTEKERGRTGRGSRALRFDGVDDAVRVPLDIRPESLPEITIAVWVRPEGTAAREVIVSNGDTIEQPYSRTLGISTGRNSGKRHFQGLNKDKGLWDIKPAANDEWSFVALMYDQKNSTAKLYVNGRTYEDSGEASSGNDSFLIGGHPAYPMNFTGLIADVRVYNRILDVQELDVLFNAN